VQAWIPVDLEEDWKASDLVLNDPPGRNSADEIVRRASYPLGQVPFWNQTECSGTDSKGSFW
jgi:hypothetical protein